MSDRPFKVLGIQQIAVGANDKAELRKLWVDVLGLEGDEFELDADRILGTDALHERRDIVAELDDVAALAHVDGDRQ